MSRPRLAPSLALAAALLACGAASSAQAAGKEFLRAEFWADLQPVAGVGDEWPVSPATAKARILEEAAWIYGGMIWGFEFEYTPYDKTRALAERFVIQPIGSLAPSALSLAPGSSTEGRTQALASNEFRSFVEYRPAAALAELMESYAQDPWKGSQGIGKADMNLGLKGRRLAYEDGLRLAVRALLQGREPNKPRLVKGRVALERPPSMTIREGYYTAQLRARVMVIEVIPYKVY